MSQVCAPGGVRTCREKVVEKTLPRSLCGRGIEKEQEPLVIWLVSLLLHHLKHNRDLKLYRRYTSLGLYQYVRA